MQKIRLGITTRIANDNSTSEPRDCLAQDWSRFFRNILPEIEWIILPNIGCKITTYCQNWGLDSFILSGGNDLGEFPLREETENTIIAHALEQSLPLLGICRGFQLLTEYFGGTLQRASAGEHPTEEHPVNFLELPLTGVTKPATVNSYHNWLIKDSGALIPFVTDAAGNIEGAYSANTPSSDWDGIRKGPRLQPNSIGSLSEISSSVYNVIAQSPNHTYSTSHPKGQAVN